MDNIIDLARLRRIKFEEKKTDRELSALDFDEFGNPIPLKKFEKEKCTECTECQKHKS